MQTSTISRRLKSVGKRPVLLMVAAGLALMWTGYRIAETYYVDRGVEAAARQAAPHLASLITILERYQTLPSILSEDRAIIEAALGSPEGSLNERLARFAETTGADAVYLMDENGWTIAASNWRRPKTFLGQNYGFRPYFKSALEGRPGEYYAIGATTGVPGYFVSHPVADDEAGIVGVIAVKVDLRNLEANWATLEGKIFITDGNGIIVLSGEPSWRFRTLSALDPDTRNLIAARRQFGTVELSPIDIEREGRAVAIGGDRFVEHVAEVGRLGWTFHFLSPYHHVQERIRLILAVVAVLLLSLAAFILFRRSQRTHGLLISSERERDELNRLNRDLEREVIERREAETRLKRAQDDLKRTSKLAALGQLAASVSHELGQPLSAMKTYIAGANLPDAFPGEVQPREIDESDGVLQQLDRLVDRMSETTRQLRFFSRRGGEAFDDVTLADVIVGALETMRPAIRSEGVDLRCRIASPDTVVRGGRMRLEQVLVNMIRNALDSMQDSPTKHLSIEMEEDRGRARIVVRDTGSGIEGGSETAIFEPFVTTKASGEGMGLGLAISSEIVKEHGGSLFARNTECGGAEFVMELPSPETADAQAE
ncbi:MAG: ATP-binding protein [Paracoccaceae bacterium]|nr:ATP-binding protein [Paracoccaceae bacterium]